MFMTGVLCTVCGAQVYFIVATHFTQDLIISCCSITFINFLYNIWCLVWFFKFEKNWLFFFSPSFIHFALALIWSPFTLEFYSSSSSFSKKSLSFGINISMLTEKCFRFLTRCPPRWRRGSGLDFGSEDPGSIPCLPSPRVGPLMARR